MGGRGGGVTTQKATLGENNGVFMSIKERPEEGKNTLGGEKIGKKRSRLMQSVFK